MSKRIFKPDSLEQDREFLLEKIQNSYRSERMFGFYLLGKSGHKQEIISHPSYIDMDKLSDLEQLFLASGIDYEFMPETTFDKSFLRALETTDLLYAKYRPLDKQATHLFQMWFTLCETALSRSYLFRNPAALAAASGLYVPIITLFRCNENGDCYVNMVSQFRH